VGKCEGKKPLGRRRHRLVDNTGAAEITPTIFKYCPLNVGVISAAPCIKMDLQEVGSGCTDWIELAHDTDRWWALVNAVINLLVP
jgi:hypothetical protein